MLTNGMAGVDIHSVTNDEFFELCRRALSGMNPNNTELRADRSATDWLEGNALFTFDITQPLKLEEWVKAYSAAEVYWKIHEKDPAELTTLWIRLLRGSQGNQTHKSLANHLEKVYNAYKAFKLRISEERLTTADKIQEALNETFKGFDSETKLMVAFVKKWTFSEAVTVVVLRARTFFSQHQCLCREVAGYKSRFEATNKNDGAAKVNSQAPKVSTSNSTQVKPKTPNPNGNTGNTCNHCGRAGHNAKHCKLKQRGHPDVNPDPKVKFDQSEKGKEWIKQNCKAVRIDRQLDGTPTGIEDLLGKKKAKVDKKQGECENTLQVMESSEDDELAEHRQISFEDASIKAYITVTDVNGEVHTMHVNVLLDTGCNSNGYISHRVMNFLRLHGVHANQTQRRVKVANGTKVSVNEEVGLSVLVNDKRDEFINITRCGVLDMGEKDLVIGYPYLRTSDTLKRILFQGLYSDSVLQKLGDLLVEIRKTSGFEDLTSMEKTKLLNEKIRLADIDWEVVESKDESVAVVEEIAMPRIIAGSPDFINRQKKLCEKYSMVFSRALRTEAALLPPMEVEADEERWETKENQQPPRIQGPVRGKEIQKQVDAMLDANTIRVSTASAYSQVLLVPKPDGSWRFCVDFRRLNAVTKSVAWPIPNIPHMLNRLGSKKPKYFAKLDLTKGYYQAPLSERSKHLTAFMTAQGLYEWNRVPMGLMGAPAYFQRIMTTVVLAGLMYIACESYMDDIIAFGQDEDEYLKNLESVFMRIKKHRLTVNPDKCELGLESIEYVGHRIDGEGLHFDPKKITEVARYPLPKKKGELKSFLGIANYFRDHVKQYAQIVAPLFGYIEGYKVGHSNHLIKWDEKGVNTFNQTKEAIENCMKLFWVDEKAPIHLYTDASKDGMGAYLCQVKEGKEVPIGIMSMTFNTTQKHWSTIEKEAYAIVKALQKFEYILRDVKFTLHTDHANLVYIRDSGSAKVHRWKLQVQEYMFDVQHIAGVLNEVADILSRYEGAPTCSDVDEEDVKPDALSFVSRTNGDAESELSDSGDGECEECPEEIYVVKEEVIIPPEVYSDIMKMHNDVCGHCGRETTLDRLRRAGIEHPNLRNLVRKFIRECPVCQKNAPYQVEANIQPFTTGSYVLMDRLNVDTIGPLPEDNMGNKYIIVIIDAFSRWVELTPTKDTSAESAAQALMNHAIRFGNPSQVVTDKGTQFNNELIRQFHRLTGTQGVTTTAYSKEENALVERANKEVMRFIRDMVYTRRSKLRWSECVPIAQRIMNSLKKAITGYAPCELLYAGAIQLDNNVFIDVEVKDTFETGAYNEWIVERFKQSQDMLRVAAERQKEHEVKHSVECEKGMRTEYKVGDLVLVAHPKDSQGKNGRPSKLDTNFEGPLRVEEVRGDSYVCRRIGGERTEPITVFRLRPFKCNLAKLNPANEAMKDKDVYEVASILGHKGTFKVKSTLHFHVMWRGYDVGDATWEPWEHLRHNSVLHAYLRKIGRESHIPKQHR